MKSISRVLSLFLVVVMCFGLFSTSAYATAMVSFDFSGGNNAAENNNASGGFNFNPTGSSDSASNGSGNIDFGGQQSQPASFEPQQPASTASGSGTTTPTFTSGSGGLLGAPYNADTMKTFRAVPSAIDKSDTTHTYVKIECVETVTFDADSFNGGFAYSTEHNGTNLNPLTQGQHYDISANSLNLFASWLKSLKADVYYFYGLRNNEMPVPLTFVSVNSGNFGTYTMYSEHYNKNATSVVETSAGGNMSAFCGYGVVGVTDTSYNKILAVDVDYTSNDSAIWLKASYLNALPDGTYKLLGFTTPSDLNTDQVVIGNFYIESGSLGVSYKVVTHNNDPYDKSKPLSGTNFVTVEPENSTSEEWLYKFTYKVTNPSGTYTHDMQQGEYSIDKWEGSSWYSFGFGEAYLNSLPDGKYTLIGIATVGSGTVETMLGSFTVTNSGLAIGEFAIYNNAYDKSKSDRAEVYAQTTDAATIALMPAASYAISGPQSKTLTKDTEYYVDSSNGFVALKTAFLDTLPDGTYTLTATFTSGANTVQKTLGNFTVSTGNLDSEFTIGNNPYDKSLEKRKAIVALAGGLHPQALVENVIGAAITGPVSKTLSYDSDYYKVTDTTNNQYYVAIRPEVLDTLPEGTYNFILTVKPQNVAVSTQITAGQFTVKASAVDADFTIANSPYDKNSTESKAVGAVPKTTNVIANITGVAISGTESRTLTSSEYYKQPDKDGKAGYVVILKDVLNTLSDGTYNFLVTITTGTSSVQKNAGQFVVESSPVDFGQFEITGSPFDKNADAPASVVATAKANGKDPVLRNFSVAGVGSITAPLVLKSGDYTYTEGTDSKPRKLELKADFVKTLADGDYYIYAEATSGLTTTQGTIGIFTVKTGTIPFGTFTMNPDTYDKNAENPTEVKAKGSEIDMKKLTGFAITTVGGSFTSTRTLSSSEYTKDATSVTIKASVLGTLPDGEYKLIGTATTGLTTEQVPIGIFYVKSGDVETGKYVIGESPYDKNKTDRKEIYVSRDVAADPRFKANSFSIVGVTNPSFSQILNVNQYTVNNNTTGQAYPWITLNKNVLDTLPDGNYKIVCSATIGNVNSQVDLGVFTVVSGDVDYGTYAIHKSPYDKNNSTDPVYAQETHNWGMLQYFSGYAISGITDPSFNQVLIGSQYSVNADKNKVTISESVLKALPNGDYNFLGFATIGQASAQVNLGMFTIKSDYGEFTIQNSPYDKNLDGASPIIATEKTSGAMKRMNGFGVASVNGSYAQPLSVNNYTRSGDEKSVRLETRYLDTLEDGQYYLIGFPTLGSTATQVILGTFIVRSGYYTIAGTAMLTPDEQVWYSGSDPLTFYSEIHELAGKGWNYKPYEWDTIVPDIRVSTYSDMRSPTSVRIDQYWDLNYGYIMLGANYLNSLSAEHTYYMQVIDARHPDILYSNVVSFRVGPTLRALDTDKHVINSTRSLRFRSSEPVARVYVGNIELTDPADFGISWDGRTVTLSFEFLNKRTGGNTYTIKVLTTGGEYASTTFQVLTTAQGSASPRTGDESNLGLWAAFLLLSGTAIVVMVPKLKKHDF